MIRQGNLDTDPARQPGEMHSASSTSGPMKASKHPGTEPVQSDHAYSLEEFRRRTGLGRNGLRAAKRNGLAVRRCGRNRYVLGSDWHDFLRRQPPTEV